MKQYMYLEMCVEQGIELTLLYPDTVAGLGQCVKKILPNLLVTLDLPGNHLLDINQYSVDHLDDRLECGLHCDEVMGRCCGVLRVFGGRKEEFDYNP